MRSFLFNERLMTDEGYEDVVLTITEQEILDTYWTFWKTKMVAKYGHGDYRITEENCIEDWVVSNWAWEKKEDDKA